MPQTNERAFETYVEEILSQRSGWKAGSLVEWDRERALFPAQIFTFIQDTQPKLWAEMDKLHGAGLETMLLAALVKELDAKGSLNVLRHGFKFYGKTFRLAYFKPAHGANAGNRVRRETRRAERQWLIVEG
jgi:type I restriction enzyme, R subunit